MCLHHHCKVTSDPWCLLALLDLGRGCPGALGKIPSCSPSSIHVADRDQKPEAKAEGPVPHLSTA